MTRRLSLLILFFSITNTANVRASEDDRGTKSSASGQVFDRTLAVKYDEKTESNGIKQSLFVAAARLLEDPLPADSKVLCVGAGTGAEIISFAKLFPEWTFMAVDPAEAMLEEARKKVEEAGISPRVRFHVGTLETLSADEREFDVTTSFLVSHFIGDEEARTSFFASIAERLKPGGYLVTADLVSDAAGSKGLFKPWLSVLKTAGFPYEDLEERGEALADGKGVPILPVDRLKTIIGSAGFEEPLQFYQWLYIHGFFSKKVITAGGGK